MYLAARGHADKLSRLEKTPQFNRTVFKVIILIQQNLKLLFHGWKRSGHVAGSYSPAQVLCLTSDNLGSAQSMKDLINTTWRKKQPVFIIGQYQRYNKEPKEPAIKKCWIILKLPVHRGSCSHLLLMAGCLHRILPLAFRSSPSRPALGLMHICATLLFLRGYFFFIGTHSKSPRVKQSQVRSSIRQ